MVSEMSTDTFSTSFFHISKRCTWEYAYFIIFYFKQTNKRKNRCECEKKGVQRALRVNLCGWMKSNHSLWTHLLSTDWKLVESCVCVTTRLVEAIFPALVFKISIKTSLTWSRPRLNKLATACPFEV